MPREFGEDDSVDLEEQLADYRAIIRIIFITAHDDAATRKRVRQSGAAGYLGTPFEGQALLDTLRRVTRYGMSSLLPLTSGGRG
jgi:FixJ family two-component response regulator